MMWTKGITIGTGQAPVKNYQPMLRDIIINGKARPSFIISDRFKVDDAPQAYRDFDRRDEVTKAVIKF